MSVTQRRTSEKELILHGAHSLPGVKCASLIFFDQGEDTGRCIGMRELRGVHLLNSTSAASSSQCV